MGEMHLKIQVTNGIETFKYSFIKSNVTENEILLAYNKLKLNFKPNEKITLSVGY